MVYIFHFKSKFHDENIYLYMQVYYNCSFDDCDEFLFKAYGRRFYFCHS